MHPRLPIAVILIAAAIACFQPWHAIAQTASENATLEARVAALEKRLNELESELSPVLAEARQKQIVEQARQAARRRMRQDGQNYDAQTRREIEQLYQSANKQLGTPAAEAALKMLIEKYPNANRTGCAVLYLGQMSQGEQAEKYLTLAMKQYPDCYYGDGVQVGPYAMWYLAHYYDKVGQPQKADAMFEQIREQYPDAINHKGRLLVNLMP